MPVNIRSRKMLVQRLSYEVPLLSTASASSHRIVFGSGVVPARAAVVTVGFTPHGGLDYHALVDAFYGKCRRAIKAIALDPAVAFRARESPPGRRIDDAAD